MVLLASQTAASDHECSGSLHLGQAELQLLLRGHLVQVAPSGWHVRLPASQLPPVQSCTQSDMAKLQCSKLLVVTLHNTEVTYRLSGRVPRLLLAPTCFRGVSSMLELGVCCEEEPDDCDAIPFLCPRYLQEDNNKSFEFNSKYMYCIQHICLVRRRYLVNSAEGCRNRKCARLEKLTLGTGCSTFSSCLAAASHGHSQCE